MKTITTEVVVAHSHCPRKAFLLLQAEGQGVPHEYVRLLEERASQNRANYLERIKQEYPGVNAGDATAFLNGQDVLM